MGSFTSKTSSAPKAKNNAHLQAQVSDIDRAVLDLKNARDRLQRYRNRLQNDGDKLVHQAKVAKASGRQSTALGLLRLRKHKLRQADACEEQLLTVLQMVETIDSKQNEKQLLEALASGKDALKRMHEETTVDDVLNLMDQVQEEIEVEREINDILQNVPTLSPADELAVEAELDQLQADLLQEAAKHDATTTAAMNLPEAPTTKLPDVTPVSASTAAAQQQPERVAVPG